MTQMFQSALTPGGATQPGGANSYGKPLYLSSVNQLWTMNVISFSSPIYGTINTSQVHEMEIHFPIKVVQPELQFDVQFASESDFSSFQTFVRLHQQSVQWSARDANLVTLNWAARDIDNWTGVIKKFQAGGERFNPAPKASFVVNTVTNFISSRSATPVSPPSWRTVYGLGMGVDAVLGAPSAGEQALALLLSGEIEH